MGKRIPLHVLQQGGVTPIQSSPLALGEAAPMIFQAAAMPVDSGAAVAAQFAQLSQRRVEHSWQRYITDVQMDMQRDNLDFQREKFAWQKAVWAKEFDYREQQDWWKNTAIEAEMLRNMDTGAQSVLGKEGIGGAMATAKTPAQVAAFMETDRLISEAIQEAHVGFENKDRAAVFAAQQKARLAPHNTGALQANAQLIEMIRQIEDYHENIEEFDPWYYTHRMQYMQRQAGVNEAPDLLVRSIQSILKDFAEANKDTYGIPQVVDISGGQGILSVIQQNPDFRNDAIQYLMTDPTGSLKKEYDLRVALGDDPTLKDGDVPFQEWALGKVTSHVNSMYNPNTKVNGTNWSAWNANFEKGKESSDDDEIDPYRQETGIGQSLGAFDVGFKTDGDSMRLDYSLWTEGENRPKGGAAGMMRVFQDVAPWLVPKDKRNVRYVDDSWSTNRLLQIGASLFFGESWATFDRNNYVNPDGQLNARGLELQKKLKNIEKTIMRDQPVTHGFINDDHRKEVNAAFGFLSNGHGSLDQLKRDPGTLFMEIGEGVTGDMYDKEQLMEEYTKVGLDKTDAQVIGEVDKENTLGVVAALQKNGGVRDPWIYGMNPWILQVTDKQSGKTRTFIAPRNKDFRENEAPALRSMNMLYVQAKMGGGEEMPLAFESDHAKQLIDGLMRDQYRAGFATEGDFQSAVKEWSDSVESIKLTGESTFTKGPLAEAQEGDIAINFSKDDRDGTIIVQDLSGAPEAMIVAQNVLNNMGRDHGFEIYQVPSGKRAFDYMISIDGKEPTIITGSPQEKLARLDSAIMNAEQVITPLNRPEGNVMQGWGGLKAMGGVRTNAEGIPEPNMQLSDIFLESEGGFRDFDELLYTYNQENDLNTNYIVTSAYRPNDEQSPEHRMGRAIDLRDTADMRTFFKSIIPDFQPTPPGQSAQFYHIPGTQLVVTLHDNRNDPKGGQHFDIRLKRAVGL